MTLSIYRKAQNLYKTKAVTITDITNNNIWAHVKDYSVRISLTDNIFSCSCLWGSINLEKIGQKNFCSHVLAVCYELTNNIDKYEDQLREQRRIGRAKGKGK